MRFKVLIIAITSAFCLNTLVFNVTQIDAQTDCTTKIKMLELQIRKASGMWSEEKKQDKILELERIEKDCKSVDIVTTEDATQKTDAIQKADAIQENDSIFEPITTVDFTENHQVRLDLIEPIREITRDTYSQLKKISVKILNEERSLSGDVNNYNKLVEEYNSKKALIDFKNKQAKNGNLNDIQLQIQQSMLMVDEQQLFSSKQKLDTTKEKISNKTTEINELAAQFKSELESTRGIAAQKQKEDANKLNEEIAQLETERARLAKQFKELEQQAQALKIQIYNRTNPFADNDEPTEKTVQYLKEKIQKESSFTKRLEGQIANAEKQKNRDAKVNKILAEGSEQKTASEVPRDSNKSFAPDNEQVSNKQAQIFDATKYNSNTNSPECIPVDGYEKIKFGMSKNEVEQLIQDYPAPPNPSDFLTSFTSIDAINSVNNEVLFAQKTLALMNENMLFSYINMLGEFRVLKIYLENNKVAGIEIELEFLKDDVKNDLQTATKLLDSLQSKYQNQDAVSSKQDSTGTHIRDYLELVLNCGSVQIIAEHYEFNLSGRVILSQKVNKRIHESAIVRIIYRNSEYSGPQI